MGITTDRLPPLTAQTAQKRWPVRKAPAGGRVTEKEQRVALTEYQSNDLREAGGRSADGQYPVADFGQGLSGQALMRGLDVVHQVSLQLQRRRSPGALAQEIIQILESTLGYGNTAILLVDRPARQLKPFALSESAFGRDFSQAYDRYVASHDLRLGVGVAGWVAHQGKSLLSGDIAREPRLESLETEMRSVLFVPIMVEGVVVGTLGVESRLINAFSAADQQLLETVASQIAIAIQNAHLFSRVRRESLNASAHTEPLGPNGESPPTEPTMAPEPEPAVSLAHTADDRAIAAVEQAQEAEAVAVVDHNAPASISVIGARSSDVVLDDEYLEELIAELRAQVEELDAFNHTVAHDLKNPLSILLGFADILAEDYASSEDEILDQAIRVIIENGRRMENIINELLLLAEVRTVEQIPLMPLDMPAIVSVTNRRLSNFIKEYRAEIIAPESWPQAMGHQPWVEEIWVNYLSNAIKYGGPSARIEVGAEPTEDGMVRFWVRDFGEGIDPADQRRLFMPFAKLQQANTKGHGLGLSIVQRIAKRLGGAVGVDSEVGQGSVFWFTLPAMPRPSGMN